MKINTFEILEYGCQTASERSACVKTSIPFELELYGAHLNLCAVCGEDEITLEDLVHPACQLCDIIIRQTIEHQRLCGQPVRCSAGCMACCKYAITVSPAEALAINSMINNLPRHARQTLLRKMTMAGRKILIACRSTIGSQSPGINGSSDSLAELSRWYAQMNLTCPYIENKRCSHYADRPLVCREFMVTSPPAQCVPSIKNARIVVDLPIRVSEVLMDVCSRLANTKPEAVFLPLVPAWCADTSDIQLQRFNAQEAAKAFVDAIQEYCKQTEFSITAVH